jgi:hypothetical protein
MESIPTHLMSASLWKLFIMRRCSSMSICCSHGLVGRGIAASPPVDTVWACGTDTSLSSLALVGAVLLCWLMPSRSDPARLSWCPAQGARLLVRQSIHRYQ